MSQDALRKRIDDAVGRAVTEAFNEGTLQNGTIPTGKIIRHVLGVCRAERAAVWRESATHLRAMLEGVGSTDDQAWQYLDYCEVKAKEEETS